MQIDDLPERYREQARKQLGNRVAICGIEPEQGRSDALDEAAKVPRFRTQVYIRITCFKCGSNWDADNIESKEATDSLVKNGVITDDTIKEVPKIFKEGVRVKHKDEERTLIEVIQL